MARSVSQVEFLELGDLVIEGVGQGTGVGRLLLQAAFLGGVDGCAAPRSRATGTPSTPLA